MASKILNFSPNRLITGINIVDNMLFYTDGENEPKKINIEKFRGNSTGEFKDITVDHSSGTTHIYNRTFEERDITVIKDHPAILSKKAETIALNENFGTGDGDLVIDEILNDSDLVVLNSDNTKVEKPSAGVVSMSIEEGTLNGLEMLAQSNFGKNVLIDAGFIWSQTESTIEGLIKGAETGSAFEVLAEDVETDGGKANTNYILTKNDTTSPYYNANLSAGDFHATSFIKLKGKNERIYSPVSSIKVIDETVSTSLASEIASKPPVKSGDGYFEWKAFVKNDGGVEPEEVGIYISQPRINENEAPPTIQDLINNGIKIKGGFIDGEITVIEKPTPNKYYYWEPYVINENGTTYGNSAALTDPASNVFKYKSFLKPNIKTLNVVESDSAGNVYLQSWYEGNKASVINGSEEASEIGFYFSTDESESFDILNKTYSGNESTDGTSYKVPISGYDFENGGGAKLNILDYITLKPEETINYIPYIVTPTGESVSAIKGFTLPKAPEKPNFYISNLDWNLKPNSTDDNGLKDTVLLDYDLDLVDMDENYDIDDIGIIISKPSTTEEIKKSTNGIWTTKDQIINDSNSVSIKIPQNDLTFTANGNSTKVGRYENTSSAELPNIDAAEYYNLISENIKPQEENWSAVGYVVIDGVTHYTNVVNKNSTITNKNSTVKSSIIGPPKVFTKNTSEASYSDLLHNSATLNGKLHYSGKNLQEIGFYLSTTKPPGANGGIAAIKNDGRSSDLNNWISSATKYTATDITVSNANTHLNQSSTEFLNFEADVTGLTAETKYYFAAFANPVQTTNAKGDVAINNSESLNNVINSIHWGNVFSFSTPKDASVVITATPAPFVAVRNYYGPTSLRKGFVNLQARMSLYSKDYSVTTKGFYLKPASEFLNPFSDQAGNASTMADPTNRLNYVSEDGTTKRARSGRATIYWGQNNLEIDTVDYYASAYIEVNETGERFISDYILVESSIYEEKFPPEIQSFQLSPPVLEGNKLSVTGNYSSNPGLGVSGTINWSKEADTGAVPTISKVGVYYINKNGASKPTSIVNFLDAYNNANGQTGWTSISKELTSGWNFIGDGKSLAYTAPLPSNRFPSSNTGKTFYAIGFLQYADSSLRYSDTIEEFYIPPPPNAIATVDQIYYSILNNGYISAARLRGENVLSYQNRTLAFYGRYRPPYVQAVIDIPDPWFIYIQKGGNGFTEQPFRIKSIGEENYRAGFALETRNPKLVAYGNQPVAKYGNIIMFAPRLSTQQTSRSVVPCPWWKYWIIREYKSLTFYERLKATKNATALLEEFADAVIELIWVDVSADGPPNLF